MVIDEMFIITEFELLFPPNFHRSMILRNATHFPETPFKCRPVKDNYRNKYNKTRERDDHGK